jgi:hypothetical protein
MIFTDVDWENVKNNYNNENIKAELKTLEVRKIDKPKQLFKIACRQLAENSESNNRFEDASNLRRMAMETEWFEKKEEIINFRSKSKAPLDFLRKFRDLFIYGLYRVSSSYGESWGRALFILFMILFVFTLIYTQVDFYNYPKDRPVSVTSAECEKEPTKAICQKKGLSLSDAAQHSLTTATFQNVDYRKPITGWGETWVILEKILAPLQAALLALAIRRKFMR